LSVTIQHGSRQSAARGLESGHERNAANRCEHTCEADRATQPAFSYSRARLVAWILLILPLVHSLRLRYPRAHEERRLLQAKLRVESARGYGTAGQIAANRALT
jgi:hypothetical protein